MNDKTSSAVRRYVVYIMIIFGWTLFLAMLTEFFLAVAVTRQYFHV